MNLGIEQNLKIAEKYCLNPNGCPKLKGKTDYNEKLAICAGCTNYLNKIDLIDILTYYHNTSTPSPKSTTHAPTPHRGKGTELSKYDIERILTLYHIDLQPITRIASECGYSFRTVKNVINQSFKNKSSNDKVREIKNKMNLPE